MFVACPQSTPLVPVLTDINWFAMPTPIIDPTSVCELDAGKPNHHVPRFQMMAATSSANTIENPRLAADLQDQFHREQGNDSECHGAARDQHADEIPHARPHYRDVRLHANACRSP